jgi:D-alanyl-D-alanine dipeptidase
MVLVSAVIAVASLTIGCSTPASSPSTTPAPTTSPTPPPTPLTPAGSQAPGDFVVLSDVDPTILHDIRYAADHNFVGRPVVGYREPLCVLTRKAADALHRVQIAALARGYGLKVYDCYRPKSAGEDFARWAKRLDDQTMKAEFYPRVSKSELFNQGFVGGGRTSHSQGSTIDLTMVANPPRTQRPFNLGEPLAPCIAPVDRRFPDNTVDMGTGFDCFDPLAHTLDSRIKGDARQNRLLLRQLMGEAGFANYAKEWWHYTLANAPHQDAYFDFPVARDTIPE